MNIQPGDEHKKNQPYTLREREIYQKIVRAVTITIGLILLFLLFLVVLIYLR